LTTELDSCPWRFILTSFRAPSWLPYPGRRRAARAREHIYREAARLVAQRRQGPAAAAIFSICCYRRAMKKLAV
jgi:hypothetical protein